MFIIYAHAVNFQHTGNFIIFLSIQNLHITFAQALADLTETTTSESHRETQSSYGIFFFLLLLCLLDWGHPLGEFLPWTANCLKCHRIANSLLHPDCHFIARYHTIYVMFLLLYGGGEKSPRIREREGGGCQRESIKGFDAKIEYKMPLLLTIWMVVLVPNPFHWLSLKISQGDLWHLAGGK